MSRYEKVEVKQKDEAVKAVRKKLHDALKLKTSAEVDRKRSKLRESNELSRYEKVEEKQKDEAAKAVKNKLDDDFKLEMSVEVDRKDPICVSLTS